MSQITYQNKDAIIENADIPVTGKVTDDDMNEIKQVVNANETKILLAVTDTEPSECSTGDMYFNTSTNLIYTATGTDTWGSTGVAPTLNTIYLELTNQTAYAYNGTTLVSVGGGAGGGGDSTPIGTVEAYAGSTAPNGYLMCDGSAVSRTTYKELFNVIGTTYGTGDGSTTFNLPNIKGRVVVMQDTSQTEFDTLGETGGSKEMQKHNHRFWEHPSASQGAGSYEDLAFVMQATLTGGGNTAYVSETGTGNSGNLQPYIVLNYIIKVQKTAGEVLSEQLPVGTEVDFDGSASDIPIGWEEVETYSTDEIKTGDTWIDGKPIYRKVISSNTQQTFTSRVSSLTLGTISNIDTLINFNVLMKAGGSSSYLNGVNNISWAGGQISTTYANTFYTTVNPSTGNIFLNRQAGSGLNETTTLDSYILIMEYTKTTD